MSLLPALLNELIDDLNNLNRSNRFQTGDLYDQHFGLGLGDLGSSRLPHLPALRAGYLRPWRNVAPPDTGTSTVKLTDRQFTVRLDVSHFKPDELNVYVDDSESVVVEGKHEERADDHGLVARQFTRKYKLPESVNSDTLASSLSTDGVLTIVASKKTVPESHGRRIKILQTNQPALQTLPKVEEKKEESIEELESQEGEGESEEE